jgi:hypothetical protein
VGVETTHSARHGGTDEVLGNVHLHQVFDFALENRFDHGAGNHGFGDDTLAAPVDPVDGCGLLVSAVVAGNGDNAHVFEATFRSHDSERVLNALRYHVHAHGVTGGRPEANVDVSTGNGGFHRL